MEENLTKQEAGVTPEELEAARVYLSRHGHWRNLPNSIDDTCSACKDKDKVVGHLKFRHLKHLHSKPHIAGAYQIPLSRLNVAIKVAKVMQALNG